VRDNHPRYMERGWLGEEPRISDTSRSDWRRVASHHPLHIPSCPLCAVLKIDKQDDEKLSLNL
jgi:hypothetical protein